MNAAAADLLFTAIRLMLPYVTSELGRLIHALVTMIEESAIQKTDLARYIEIVYEITREVDEVAATAPVENPLKGEEKRIIAVAKVEEACRREFPTLEIPTRLTNAMLELVLIFRKVSPDSPVRSSP
jgi:hypothetical protein